MGVERGREVEEYEGRDSGEGDHWGPHLNTITVGFCMNGCSDFTISQADINNKKKMQTQYIRAQTHKVNVQKDAQTDSLCQRLALLDYLRTRRLSLLQRSLSIKVADKLIMPQGHLLGAVWQQTGSIANQCSINRLS